MSIPAVSGAYAVLPPGRHRATLDEMRSYFVDGAPFPEERRIVFKAFEAWLAQMSALIPSARYWIDGGFVTHKTFHVAKSQALSRIEYRGMSLGWLVCRSIALRTKGSQQVV